MPTQLLPGTSPGIDRQPPAAKPSIPNYPPRPNMPSTPGPNYVGPPAPRPTTPPSSPPYWGGGRGQDPSWPGIRDRPPRWSPGQPFPSTPRPYVGPPAPRPKTPPTAPSPWDGGRPMDPNWPGLRDRPPQWKPGQQFPPNPGNMIGIPRAPVPPRSPGNSPRWPRWARIPPKAKLPIAIGGGMLIPTLPDLIFGIVPGIMEGLAPGFWDWIGWPGNRPPGTAPDNAIQAPNGGRVVIISQGNRNVVWSSTNPFSFWVTSLTLNTTPPTPAYRLFVRNFAGSMVVNGAQWSLATASYPFLESFAPGTNQPTGDPIQLDPGQFPFPPNAPVIPGPNGWTPHTGLPTTAPGKRPGSHPGAWRPDLNPIPDPRPTRAPDPTPPPGDDPNGFTGCRLNPDTLTAIQQRIDNLERLELQTFDSLITELNKLKSDQINQPGVQVTPLQVRYVTENASGQRQESSQVFNILGVVDVTGIASLIAQTVGWAMGQNQTARIYQILGGDAIWGSEPQPQTQFNPDSQMRATPVINAEGASQTVAAVSLVGVITALAAAAYQRQGLQRFPTTVTPPSLNNQGFLDNPITDQIFKNAADVTITTSSRGYAAITGLNEVIRKTKLTIQFLRLDRLLNLLNLAATLHNAAMLSRDLLETLVGTIENVLAMFGLKDAEGNPFDIGGFVSGTISNVLTTILGAETVQGISQTWNKANRILTAASNVVWSVRSIGDSILSALSVGFGWVGKIGNALELAGVIHERFWQMVNPNPNFQNRYFTAIEQAEDVLSNIDAVAGEVLAVTDSISQIEQSRADILQEITTGTGTPTPPHTPTTQAATQATQQSLGAPTTLADVIPPAPPNS